MAESDELENGAAGDLSHEPAAIHLRAKIALCANLLLRPTNGPGLASNS